MPGFVLADQPVVHARPDEGRYGFASQLAIGDANLIMVPIKRRLLAFYTVQPLANRDFTLETKRGLRIINAALCRNAVKEVACHSEDARDASYLIREIDRYPASALTDGRLEVDNSFNGVSGEVIDIHPLFHPPGDREGVIYRAHLRRG